MRRLLTFTVLLLSCLVAWGQSAVVSGRFFDTDSKEGVVGAIVEITSARDSLFRRNVITGYGGYFKSTPLPRGEYKLTSTFLGYADYQRKIKVEGLPVNLGDMPMSLSMSVWSLKRWSYRVLQSWAIRCDIPHRNLK